MMDSPRSLIPQRPAVSPLRTRVLKLLAIAWVVVPPLIFSALVHATDSSVGGLKGLSEPAVLWSVLVYGAPLAGFAICTLWMTVNGNWWMTLGVLCAGSALLGLVLVVLGSTASTLPQLLRSLAGSSFVVFAFFVVALLPSVGLWPDQVRIAR